jgi:hypothetical protein
MAMAEKSSVNENKVFVMNVTESRKLLRSRRKVHESGRGEVHSAISGDVSHVTPFFR